MPSTGSWSFLSLVIMIVFRSLISIAWTGDKVESRQQPVRIFRLGLCSVAICQMTPSVTKYGREHCILTIVFTLCHSAKPGLLSSQTEVVEKHATMKIIAIFFWTYFMIKFWYFVIQNLDKACYINFLIGTLVQLWVACPPYLLISSKHRIQAEKDYNLWTDFKWLCKIFRDYAMTNKFLHRMDIKLMPWSQHTLCVLRSWIMILIRPSSSLLPPPSNLPFKGTEPLSDNDEL